MSTEIKVPRLAESISEATLVEWLRPHGAAVKLDEPVATLETDKAAVEIVAPAAGVLQHARKVGETVLVGDLLATVAPGSGTLAADEAPASAAPATPAAPAAPAADAAAPHLSPAVRRVVAELGVNPAAVPGSGPGGRLLKEDVERHVKSAATPEPAPAASAPTAAPFDEDEPGAGERVVPMSRIRLRIAERLVQAQHTAAILTTFNEVDMSRVMETRARFKDAFEKKHGVRLGFMSFFARACVLAFADVPAVNAEIRGSDIVYHDHVHLGVAASTPRGLVVPVVRHAERLDFAGIEREIARLAQRGRDGQLSPQELSGGTFTITNGGVFGSLLSTPILNPPQSGILGMHKIEKRPVVVDDQVVVRPMMYLALSYDHRLIDGEQAVTFLVRVKERLEDPERLLLAV
ncbi:MAG: 2-oxoglutarate dehydrogenase complex dihydrolipoyllysine-residue succinyltransferase [Candidatus Eisenbacteria bacterium]